MISIPVQLFECCGFVLGSESFFFLQQIFANNSTKRFTIDVVSRVSFLTIITKVTTLLIYCNQVILIIEKPAL